MRDLVVCFDGTLEVHSFTCEPDPTPGALAFRLCPSPLAPAIPQRCACASGDYDICHPPAVVITESSGHLTDGSAADHYSSDTDCGVLLQVAATAAAAAAAAAVAMGGPAWAVVE